MKHKGTEAQRKKENRNGCSDARREKLFLKDLPGLEDLGGPPLQIGLQKFRRSGKGLPYDTGT
jgi:hypothetical protein